MNPPQLTAVFSADFLGGSELFNLEYLQRVATRDVQIDAILPGNGDLKDAVKPLTRSIQVVPPPPALTAMSRFDNRVSKTGLPKQGLAGLSYGRRLRQAVGKTRGPVCCLGFRAQLAIGYLAKPRDRKIAWVVHEVVPDGPFGTAWSRAGRRASAIYAYSATAGRQSYLQHSAVKVIPAQLNLDPFLELQPASSPIRVLGLIGDLFRLKNHLALFELVSRIRQRGHEVRGIIIGRAQMEEDPEYARQIAQIAEERGYVTVSSAEPAEIPERMGDIDLLLHLSTVPESFGRVCVEAMAAGRPVVAYDHGAVGQIINTGTTGFLVPPGDLDAVEQAILTLVKDPSKFAEQALAARRVARAKYSAIAHHATIGDALADLADIESA